MSKLYIPERHQTNDNDSQGGKGPSSNDEGKVLVFVSDKQFIRNDKNIIVVSIMKLRIMRVVISFWMAGCGWLPKFRMCSRWVTSFKENLLK